MSQNSSYTHTSPRTTVSWLCVIRFQQNQKCDRHRFQQNQKCDRHLNLFNEVFFFIYIHCAKFDKNMFFNTLNSSHSRGKPTETQWECVYVRVHAHVSVCVCVCSKPNILIGLLLHTTYPFFRFVRFQLSFKACTQLFLHFLSTFAGSL